MESPDSDEEAKAQITQLSSRTRPATASEGIGVARNLKKTYDTGKVKVEALRGVDLTVKEGEMIAVMGPSGCGKTTLLNCMSGLDDLTAGEVYVRGRSLSKMGDRART